MNLADGANQQPNQVNAPFGVFFAMPEALGDALNHMAQRGLAPWSVFKLEAFPGVEIEKVIGAAEWCERERAARVPEEYDEVFNELRGREVFCVVTMPVPGLPPASPDIINPFVPRPQA